MSYAKATFHVMSGTGNSFRAASWMRDAAAASGADAQMVSIGKQAPPQDEGGGEGRLVGLVFPTHGFTAPWAVLRHAWRLPRGRGAHAVVVPTRAGSKFGPLFLPGMEGTAGYLIALVLALKGYSVRGVMGLDMPSNFMIAHPGFPPASARAIIARGETKALGFIETVLGGPQRAACPNAAFGARLAASRAGRRRFAGFISLLLGLVLLPVSLAYALVGRFYLAKMMFANSACNGCGLCAKHCPFGAIRMWGREKPRPYWTFSCENCLRCLAWCPRRAVESGHSLGVILYFVATLPAAVYAMNWLGAKLSLPNNVATRLLLQYPYILLSLFVTYLLFALVIRIPAINRLFTYTTLVHYYRRYHEPDTSLEDLGPGGEAQENRP